MKSALVLFACCLAGAAGCSTTSPSVSQWEYTGGPYAQNVSAVLVDGQNAGSLIAGLTNGEIWSTTNDGMSWSKISSIRTQSTVFGFAQDPERWERIFATTGKGVFISTDRGKNWQQTQVEPGAGGTISSRAFAIDPWHPNLLYAGLKGKGLYKSTDSGKSWFTIGGGADPRIALSEPYEIRVDISHPDIVYAAVSGLGLLKSTDAGLTWKRLTEEFSATSTTITCFALKEKNTQTIVYGTSSGHTFRSTDGGESWSPTRNGQEADGIISFASLPSNPDFLFAGTENGVLTSTDFGASWSVIPEGLPKLATSVVTATRGGSNSSVYAFGSGIGVQRSADHGATWQRADAKLGGSTVSVVSVDANSNRVYAGVRNTLLYYKEDAGLWVPASTGIAGESITSVSFDQESSLIMFVTTTTGAYKSNDGGTTWKNATRGLRMTPDFLDTHPWIKTRMFASGDQGLFVSTDKGETWTQTRPAGARFQVRSMTFMPTNAGIVLGASPNGGVISTRNGGVTWESARYGISGNDVIAVTMDDKDPSVYYAWTSKGDGYRTTNQGVEWNHYSPPWHVTDTVSIAFDRYHPSSVVALVNGRDLYYSTTGGGTWVPILERDLHAEVESVCWDARTSTFYAGTRDKGVYRISIGQILRSTFGD